MYLYLVADLRREFRRTPDDNGDIVLGRNGLSEYMPPKRPCGAEDKNSRR